MSGISAETCISLILQHIGGIPLKPTTRSMVEGSPVTKQLGMAGFSLPGLETLQGAFNGIGTESLLGNVFQNPVGVLSDAVSTATATAQSALESSFVATSTIIDEVTGLPTTIREVGGDMAGKLSLDQIDSLKANIGSLGNSMPAYKDLTDKISGVKLPDYALGNDFGLQQVVAVQGSYSNLAKSIPGDLDAQVGGLSGAINDNLGKITEPLNIGSSLTDTNAMLNNATAQLSAAAPYGASAVQAKYNEIMNTVTETRNLVNGTVGQSKATMGTFINGSQAMGYVETASGGLMGGNALTGSLINQVVKPTPLAQIKEGIARYAPATLET